MPNNIKQDFGLMQGIADTGAPASGTWNAGDYVINTAPAAASPLEWLCTSGGSPGTWVSTGPLQAVATVTANSAAASIPVTANIVSITGSGGYSLTLAAPTAAQSGTQIGFVNASSGTVTLVAATGAAIVGLATIAANTQGTVRSVNTNWYRV